MYLDSKLLYTQQKKLCCTLGFLLIREIILQPMGEHKIEIECILMKLCPFEASRGRPSKMAK